MKILLPLAILAAISCSASKNTDISVARKSATPITFTTIDTMEVPYHTIPDYPIDFNSGHMIGRVIDGLGYRYYWATKDLRPEDLAYKISEDSRSSSETLDHLYGLASMINNTARNAPNVRPIEEVDMTWEEKRTATLMKLKEASDVFKSKDQSAVSEAKIIFERNGERSEVAFWHLLNGPLADALTHVGQILAFRRASGNPQDPTVNVFMGKNRGE